MGVALALLFVIFVEICWGVVDMLMLLLLLVLGVTGLWGTEVTHGITALCDVGGVFGVGGRGVNVLTPFVVQAAIGLQVATHCGLGITGATLDISGTVATAGTTTTSPSTFTDSEGRTLFPPEGVTHILFFELAHLDAGMLALTHTPPFILQG
jgi:hypothetical protein